MLINIKFQLDYSRIGHLTGLISQPSSAKLPSKFTIRVNRLAQARIVYKGQDAVELYFI